MNYINFGLFSYIRDYIKMVQFELCGDVKKLEPRDFRREFPLLLDLSRYHTRHALEVEYSIL